MISANYWLELELKQHEVATNYPKLTCLYQFDIYFVNLEIYIILCLKVVKFIGLMSTVLVSSKGSTVSKENKLHNIIYEL